MFVFQISLAELAGFRPMRSRSGEHDLCAHPGHSIYPLWVTSSMKHARDPAPSSSAPSGRTKRRIVTFVDLEERRKQEVAIQEATLERIQTIQRGSFDEFDRHDVTPLGIFINYTMEAFMGKFVPPPLRRLTQKEADEFAALCRRLPESHKKWTEGQIREIVRYIRGVDALPENSATDRFFSGWYALVEKRP
ncbi:hypothetical protein PAPYR_7383 [Paratrimastix pyriformis]|uniref:Uncharacterized protein n=1 Tax=Paratrimastix pyriformis TaxID=342808 RepID=A0ABQ8UKB6_9EUKA|nr:hypothetical protein PAPYR_7383 [Paratrimastix pyriformis]